MNRIRISELERSASIVRESLITMTDEELVRISKILANARSAVYLEEFSRSNEKPKAKESVLV